VKLSILYQYHRVFMASRMRIAIYATGVFCILVGIVALATNLFMCHPVAKFWHSTLKGSCISQLGVWFSNATLNILTDAMIFLLPMPALKRLRLPRRQKYGLMAVFALGFL